MSPGVRITWLGHSTFLLQAPEGTNLLVDPFVHSNPKCPDSMKRFERLDLIAITHAHVDHVGDVLRIHEESPPKAIVCIVELAHWLRVKGLPAETVIEFNKGGTVSVEGIDITMVDANHTASFQDGDELRYGGEPAGLVFGFSDGTRVYHAGDTNVFLDMSLIGELYRPDVALLPIGDHFTMGPREAAKACELLDVRRVIPMHYGTWPVLRGTPEELRAECDERGLDVEVIALRPGESWP